MKDLRNRLAQQNLTLALDDTARGALLEEGYSPAMGARPLRRAIERLLTRPLSGLLLEDAFKPGQTIYVRAAGDGLMFSTDSPADYAEPRHATRS